MSSCSWRTVARFTTCAAYSLLALLVLGLPSARGISASAAWSSAAHPLASLPVVRQSQPNSCGPAALATLLAWLDRPLSEAHLLSLAELGPGGLSLGEFARLAQALDLPGSWYRSPISELAKLPSPFFAHLELPEATSAGHLVLVHQVAHGYVIVADPAHGGRVMSIRQFSRHYSGRAYLLESPS